MKKYLQATLFSCLILSAMTSQAQITMGFRAGVNLATYHYEYGSNFPTAFRGNQPNNVPLLTIGVPFQMNLSPHFALQMELNFIQKGLQSKSDIALQGSRFTSDTKLILNWLELPILAKARFGSNVGLGGGIFFGPSIGYGLSGQSKGTSTQTTNGVSITTSNDNTLDFEDDGHSRADFGLNLGGEINYGGIFFDARYQLGLTNLVKDSGSNNSSLDFKAQNRGLALTAGYRLPIGLAGKKK